MSRHSRALEQLHERIQDGEIGDIVTMFAYRMTGPVGSAFSGKWPGKPSELLWQIQNFHSFIWASGGCFNDFYIHVIDHCCWMKNAWPVKAQAVGGRHYRESPEGGPCIDQNFDVVFGGIHVCRRRQADCGWTLHRRLRPDLQELCARHQGQGGRLQGAATADRRRAPTRASARTTSKMTWESKVDPRPGKSVSRTNGTTWSTPSATTSRTTKSERGVQASLVSSLGRKAAHTGVEITLEEMLNSPRTNTRRARTSSRWIRPHRCRPMPKANTPSRSPASSRTGNIN